MHQHYSCWNADSRSLVARSNPSRNRMKILIAFATTALTFAASHVWAAEVAMRRVLSCEGPDAKMEVYLPEVVVTGTGVQNVKFDKPITGAYSLDLTDAGKGKTLEPVRVSLSR